MRMIALLSAILINATLAVAQNQPNAKVNLQKLLPRLSADQITEGRKLAAEFIPKPVSITNSFNNYVHKEIK